MNAITRGTTPTISVLAGERFADWDVYHLCFEAGAEIVKETDELTIEPAEGGVEITATLTQADTLAFTAGIDCEIQLRVASADGSKADGTLVASIPVARILEEGAIGGTGNDGEGA